MCPTASTVRHLTGPFTCLGHAIRPSPDDQLRGSLTVRDVDRCDGCPVRQATSQVYKVLRRPSASQNSALAARRVARITSIPRYHSTCFEDDVLLRYQAGQMTPPSQARVQHGVHSILKFCVSPPCGSFPRCWRNPEHGRRPCAKFASER